MTDREQDLLANPKISEHYALLQRIGVFAFIDQLSEEIREYKSLISGAAEIFNRTRIDEIMDATVWQISDQFLPTFITFLWKPHQDRSDVTIKSYKNYKMIDLGIKINTITPLEPFFQNNREPINYQLLKEKLEEDPGALGSFTALDPLGPELVIPLLGPSGLYGIILVGAKTLTGEYTLSELNFLKQLTIFASLAIQNHLHYEDSVRDVKTGLFNHGFFKTRLMEELFRSKRTNCRFSLISIDVDTFKLFNDTYGHLAGDRVLESIAYMIKKNIRSDDIPSRFGGEEFNILLPNTDQVIAWMVAERLRLSIARMEVPWEPPLPQVTISLGVITYDNKLDLQVDEILHHADEALYRSKELGRNRTTLWKSGILFRIQNSYRKTS